jgi:hypothetical protein
MPTYAPELTLREGRAQYFLRAGFDNGGYSDRWVRLKAGPITFMFPNTAARVRAVKLHDLHHVLTEYDTTWTGEAEIGAWEIASGCGRHYPAWLLNLGAFAIGLGIAPRETYRAFVRGRHSGNLYHTEFSESLLERSIGEVRRELSIDMASPPRPTLSDNLAFLLWVILSIAPWVFGAACVGAGFSRLFAKRDVLN